MNEGTFPVLVGELGDTDHGPVVADHPLRLPRRRGARAPVTCAMRPRSTRSSRCASSPSPTTRSGSLAAPTRGPPRSSTASRASPRRCSPACTVRCGRWAPSTPADAPLPWWEPAVDASVNPWEDSICIGGVDVRKGTQGTTPSRPDRGPSHRRARPLPRRTRGHRGGCVLRCRRGAARCRRRRRRPRPRTCISGMVASCTSIPTKSSRCEARSSRGSATSSTETTASDARSLDICSPAHSLPTWPSSTTASEVCISRSTCSTGSTSWCSSTRWRPTKRPAPSVCSNRTEKVSRASRSTPTGWTRSAVLRMVAGARRRRRPGASSSAASRRPRRGHRAVAGRCRCRRTRRPHVHDFLAERNDPCSVAW